MWQNGIMYEEPPPPPSPHPTPPPTDSTQKETKKRMLQFDVTNRTIISVTNWILTSCQPHRVTPGRDYAQGINESDERGGHPPLSLLRSTVLQILHWQQQSAPEKKLELRTNQPAIRLSAYTSSENDAYFRVIPGRLLKTIILHILEVRVN